MAEAATGRGRARWPTRLWLLLVLGTVAVLLVRQWRQLVDYDWRPSLPLLAAALLFSLLRKALGGVLWLDLLRGLSPAAAGRPPGRILGIYFLSNLASYLPGSLWYIPWRMRSHRQLGIPASHTAVGSAMESLILVLANALIGLPLLLLRGEWRAEPWIVLLVLLLGALVIQPPVLRLLFRLLRRALGRDLEEPCFELGRTLRGMILAALAALATGASLYCLARGLTPSLSPGDYLYLTAAFSLAWVVGFLTPIAPGGLGVREGLLLWLLSQPLPLPVATVVAVASRLLFLIEDVFWAAASWLAGRRRRP